MTQDEKWIARWQEVVDFIKSHERNPSKFVPEERNMRSFVKHSKKLLNAGKLREERVAMFNELLALKEKYKHKNQYE